jgi:hypothetical protein
VLTCIANSAATARPAERAVQQVKGLRYYESGQQRPYVHLVDRLRAAAATTVLDSPDFQRYLKDMGERIVKKAASKPAPAP